MFLEKLLILFYENFERSFSDQKTDFAHIIRLWSLNLRFNFFALALLILLMLLLWIASCKSVKFGRLTSNPFSNTQFPADYLLSLVGNGAPLWSPSWTGQEYDCPCNCIGWRRFWKAWARSYDDLLRQGSRISYGYGSQSYVHGWGGFSGDAVHYLAPPQFWVALKAMPYITMCHPN